ncbi:proteinaceous RNase P 2-like [Trifolium pratense]|uniref:proteinaceous RNase P 2-like n=1 Tax=Trifolium pratense TaxID=57577 RepID=UPI001E69337F|nr:proteinaceous RNase P 2-like [Trifolium pratense]XP_045806592.1 proteinaceous RNase P 2-like [Trifolium pratense]
MEAKQRLNPTTTMTTNKKKKINQTPENKFQFELNSCSKSKNFRGAISLYDDAVSNKTRLNQHHLNALLYLCSNAVTNPSLKHLALDYGFRIFNHMSSLNITPNEATVATVARLAAANGDGDRAFELVKDIGKYNVSPRLRTYDPALFCFCEFLDADKAYEVEEHMNSVGVSLEEPEIAALLKVSVKKGRADRVYKYLHKLRSGVRCIGESTATIIEEWFQSSEAREVGEENLDARMVREGVLRNGGGWHGLGWVGKGDWVVSKTRVDGDGICCGCGEQLVCVDIDDEEMEKFALSIAALAVEREVKANFSEFQGWLEKHDCYEAIVDGANIGLYQQNFANGGFSINQLDDVVKELYNRSGKKWPLVILHNKRVRGLMENPSSRILVEEWMKNGVLYTTPNGSNDDWYWLYAAIKLRCLLVTNDEMRDHIFELIGSNFFNQWKERHQVHYTFVKGNLKLQMPPSYSLVIQESEKGSWHVPLALGTSNESSRPWLCITRKSADNNVATVSNGVATSGNGDLDQPQKLADNVRSLDSQVIDNNSTSITGKRKERSEPS